MILRVVRRTAEMKASSIGDEHLADDLEPVDERHLNDERVLWAPRFDEI